MYLMHSKHNTNHHRRSIRLQGYDYSSAGAYFVTLCTHNKECLFGSITNDEKMQLNSLGKSIVTSWQWLVKQYAYVDLDEWVVMPNHMHGIIIIADNLGSQATSTDQRKSLGELIGAFKAVSTKHINIIRNTPSKQLWQRNYWEHVVRNEQTLNNIREYIVNNPTQWKFDQLNLEHPLL